MDLSIVICGNNEMFHPNTVQDLIDHTGERTEIIAVLDGGIWQPIPKHPRVNVIYLPTTVGQRAATNVGARLSKAKYIAKADAHCSFDEGFDQKMLDFFKEQGDNIIGVPIMRNLHAFDWKCYHCGWKMYQGPTPEKCGACGKTDKIRRKMIWQPRKGTYSHAYSFDSEPHFQYGSEFKQTAGYKNGVIVGYKLSLSGLTTSDLLKKVMPVSIIGSQPSFSPSVIGLLTDFANSHHLASGTYHFWGGENMTMDTMSLSPVNNSGSIGTTKILGVGDELKVDGVATPSILTEMVNDRDVLAPSSGDGTNKPSINDSMCHLFISETSTSTITPFVGSPNPIPTTGSSIDSDIIQKLNNIIGGKFVYNEKTSSYHNGSVALIPIYNKTATESMSLQGSFFMSTRDKYWELNLSDEKVGSWGNQGIELACKMWLSGGRVLVNHKTWYAHMFRTQGKDFSFPYEQSGHAVEKTKQKVWEHFFGNFKQQIHPPSWLVEKFWPIPVNERKGNNNGIGWTEQALADLKEKERQAGLNML